MRLIVCCLLAGACSAADLIVMRGGTEIPCRVLSVDETTVRIEVSGVEVTFERARVVRIQRDVAETVRRPTPPARQTEAMPGQSALRLESGLSAGWVFGSVESSGRLTANANGASAELLGAYDLDGTAMMPGLWLRPLWLPLGGHRGPALGLQVGLGGGGSGETTYQQRSLAAVGGWTWRADTVSWSLLMSGGLAWADLDRQLLIATSGQPDETAASTAALSGWTAGGEGTVARHLGALRIGLSAGLSYSRLDGSDSWTSSGGSFSANEQLTATMTLFHAGVFAGFDW